MTGPARRQTPTVSRTNNTARVIAIANVPQDASMQTAPLVPNDRNTAHIVAPCKVEAFSIPSNDGSI